MDFSKGEKCYIVVSNFSIAQVEIQNINGGLYMVKFIDSGKVTRVKSHRLYNTYDEAKKAMPERKDERRRRNPWDV